MSEPVWPAIGTAKADWLTVQDTRLAFYDSLPPGVQSSEAFLPQEPLILIHGFCSLAWTWHEVFDQLAARRRTIAVDLKGFGASDKPADGDYSIDAQAALIVAMMDSLKLERALLIGNSLGGSIALRVAQRWPQRVTRLVLVNPAAYHTDEFLLLARLVLAASQRMPEQLAQMTVSKLARLPGFIESRLRRAHYLPETVTAERLSVYSAMLKKQDCQRAIVATLRTLDLRPVENNLPLVRQPALIIQGQYDRVVPVKSGRKLAQDLPEAELQMLPCGHAPQEELPAEFVRLVNEYLTMTSRREKTPRTALAQ